MLAKWLVVGGASVLLYLVFTGKQLVPRPGKATPLPQGPPVQNPSPGAQPQAQIVPGASSSILQDAATAAGIVGTLADAAKKFGIFGGSDTPPITGPTTAPTFQNDPAAAFGAAFF